MIQRCIGFLLGLSCLYWLETPEQVYRLLSVSFLLLLIYYFVISLVFQPSDKKPISKLTFNKGTNSLIWGGWLILGSFWGAASASLWLFQVPNLVATPKVVKLQGYLCSIPQAFHRTQGNNSKIPLAEQAKLERLTFNFCVSQIDGKELSFLTPNKVKLTLYRPPFELVKSFKAGSFWQFEAKLKPLHSRLNPGGFNYHQWLVSHGFIASGYIKTKQPLNKSFSFAGYYHQVRQKIFDQINQLAPNSQYKGLLLALAMGERKDISQQQWQALKGSGTAHLLAISGLHIGIAAIWSFYLLTWLFSRFKTLITHVPAQKLAIIGSLLAALTVALLSGMGYPAQRALLMLLIFVYTKWNNRHLSLASILSIGVLIIGILQPFAILTISFWLSVMAVAAIVLVLNFSRGNNIQSSGFEAGKVNPVKETICESGVIESKTGLLQSVLQRLANPFARLKDWIRLNSYLFVSLMPITWVIFDGFSIVGLLANLILIPLTSFLTTPLVYLASLAMTISQPLAKILFWLADRCLYVTFVIQDYFNSLNDLVAMPQISRWQFGLLMLLAFLFLLPKNMPPRKIILPTLVVILLSFIANDKPDKLKMLVFDIGQGLAIFIQVGEKSLVFDTGYGKGEYSLVKSSLLPYLSRNGIQQLDKLIISHKDSDHAGGLGHILQNLKVEQLLIGERLKPHAEKLALKYRKPINCHQYDSWRWDEVEFKFVNRSAMPYEKGNNQSCVLLIKVDGKKLLITGDIEESAEYRLLDAEISNLDVLLAPHHGSLTSSSNAFVSYTRPKLVIYSTGFANQWGFPKIKVRKRYQKIGAKELITHRDGAIEIQIDQQGNLGIISEGQRASHFWRRKALD